MTALALLGLLPPRAASTGRAYSGGRDLVALGRTSSAPCAGARSRWSSRTR